MMHNTARASYRFARATPSLSSIRLNQATRRRKKTSCTWNINTSIGSHLIFTISIIVALILMRLLRRHILRLAHLTALRLAHLTALESLCQPNLQFFIIIYSLAKTLRTQRETNQIVGFILCNLCGFARKFFLHKVFMDATGKTKFVRTLHTIVLIESTHVFPSYHYAPDHFQSAAMLSKLSLYIACMLILSGQGTGKLSPCTCQPKFIFHCS